MNQREINALKFYIGDVCGTNPFYSDSKAYVVLNSLFFPDIYSEKLRSAEGKYLNPEIIADIPRLLGFYNDLFSLFGKLRLEKAFTSYRVERMADFEMCRSLGRTISMTSTSLSEFLDSYRDRRGIALMRFELNEGEHCIDVAKVLDYYAKPEEREVLIPPFMNLDLQENILADNEKRITDCDGNPPIISVSATLGKVSDIESVGNNFVADCRAGIRVYEALNSGKEPENEDILEYSIWKKIFQKQLYDIFRQYII